MKTITNFWNYFQKNNFVFLLLNEIEQDELRSQFNKLKKMLHQYNANLDIVIKYKNTCADLIITANGNPYLFKEVELLVHHAPKIERWNIKAFLQPETNLTKFIEGTDKPFNYCGINLKISDMYFIPIQNPNKPTVVGIKVLLKNYIVHKENPNIRDAVYILIEHLVGEKIFANAIEFIEIGQLDGELKNGCAIYALMGYINKLGNNTSV